MVQALATALKISEKKLNRALKCAKYVPPPPPPPPSYLCHWVTIAPKLGKS